MTKALMIWFLVWWRATTDKSESRSLGPPPQSIENLMIKKRAIL